MEGLGSSNALFGPGAGDETHSTTAREDGPVVEFHLRARHSPIAESDGWLSKLGKKGP